MSDRELGREDRALTRAAIAAGALALAALFWPGAARRMFVYADLGHFFLPIRMFLAENLERGITPLWMPDLFCGFYVHGEGQIGIFHPLRWLLYRLLPVPEAFNLECLIPYPLALAGMALFLRRLALPASAAIFGGLTFAFSAYLTLRLTHLNALAVLAHLGWLLLAIDVLVRDEGRARVRAWLGLALLTGSQWLVGYPAAIAYSWLIAIPYALFAAASRERIVALWMVASALAIGTMLGAIQVLPTWENLASSSRAAPSFEFQTHFSLHPLNLLSALSPWLFRHHIYTERWYDPVERAFYFGPVVPIAALWVALRWRQLGPWRPLLLGLFALAAVALVLALGKYTPAYRYFTALPLAGLMRVPARYSIALYFAGAVSAAVAFADLLRGDPESRRRSAWIWLVPALSWLVAGTALALRGPSWIWITDQLNPPRWIGLGPLAFTAAAALWSAAVRGHRAALFGLVALALADAAGYAAAAWWNDPPRTLAEYRASITPPPAPPPQRVATPWYFDIPWMEGDRVLYWSSTPLIVHGARLVSGYAAVMPPTRLDYTKPASLRVAGAAALFTRDGVVPLPGALPRARMVASAVPSEEPARDITAIDVAATALVEEEVALGAGPPGTAQIEREIPGAIEIAAQAPTRQLLVLAERWHEGWHVAIDGQPARVLHVYGDFMGTVLDAGAHRVEFRFAPRSFAVGRAVSLAGVGAVVAVALCAWLGARRAGAAASPP